MGSHIVYSSMVKLCWLLIIITIITSDIICCVLDGNKYHCMLLGLQTFRDILSVMVSRVN